MIDFLTLLMPLVDYHLLAPPPTCIELDSLGTFPRIPLLLFKSNPVMLVLIAPLIDIL